MGDVNSITITGNIGRDAETRAVSSGNTVTTFTVANNQYRGGENATIWYTVSLWGKRGESLAQYLTAGTKVAVTGKHFIREYDAKDGSKGKANEIDANDVALIGSKGDGGEAPRASGKPASAGRRNVPQAVEDDDSTIPF